MRKTWDYVIIGAGSAGATLAGRLAQNSDRRVLLIEAGGGDLSPLIRIPGLVETVIGSRALNWGYEGEPDATLGGRGLTWAAGRALGGSSSINGMVYGRGLPADYARWVDAGNPGWGWDDMLPYFRRMEHWTGPPDPARGREGPLWVRRFEDTDGACADVMDALIRQGVPSAPDYAVGITDGVGLTQATQKNGLRHSAANAYLETARGRPNLTVRTRTTALNLIIEKGRCVGVRAVRRGRVEEFRAERETILCAGAIASPKLLWLSGVGPAEDLHCLGIPVKHALAGVGRNLNDHVNIKLSAFVNHRTYNTRRAGLSALAEGLRFVAIRSGPATSPANHVQAFVRTDAESPAADVQLQVMPIGFGTPEEMARDGLTVVVSPCHPEARGRVTLRSDDPRAAPQISMAMLESRRDQERLLRGCKLAYRALQEGPGRTMGGRIYAPAEAPRDDAAWLTFFRETAALNWHPTSTCRMGPGAHDVVDGQLRIHGLEGISIADASVMPCVTSGNTNAPVIAIAERAAETIAARTG
jgi:choline dehydrogenase